MKALITGGGGFAGRRLQALLEAAGYAVRSTALKADPENDIKGMDMTVPDLVERTIAEEEPDVIFHLAAQSSVAVSWKEPQLTAQVNVIGTINLLEAVKKNRSKAAVLLIGSGEEYGYFPEGACPLEESVSLHPGNIYAATKVCQEMLGEIYHRSFGLNTIMVRAFNHSGPGQSDTFVISAFCRQIAEIELGIKAPEISVGNLAAKRDFTDVRDIVRAYRLLAEKGVPGEVYNVGRGKAVSIQSVLDTVLGLCGMTVTVKPDPSRMRASDIPVIEPDVSKIYRCTGWRAEISLEQTIADTLDWWRSELSKRK